jgi:hypothetical protein
MFDDTEGVHQIESPVVGRQVRGGGLLYPRRGSKKVGHLSRKADDVGVLIDPNDTIAMMSKESGKNARAASNIEESTASRHRPCNRRKDRKKEGPLRERKCDGPARVTDSLLYVLAPSCGHLVAAKAFEWIG